MTTKELRELLECIDDNDLEHCSLGDHSFHDTTARGTAAIADGWEAVRAPNELLEAAQQVLSTQGSVLSPELVTALVALRTAVANATGETGPS